MDRVSLNKDVLAVGTRSGPGGRPSLRGPRGSGQNRPGAASAVSDMSLDQHGALPAPRHLPQTEGTPAGGQVPGWPWRSLRHGPQRHPRASAPTCHHPPVHSGACTGHWWAVRPSRGASVTSRPHPGSAWLRRHRGRSCSEAPSVGAAGGGEGCYVRS